VGRGRLRRSSGRHTLARLISDGRPVDPTPLGVATPAAAVGLAVFSAFFWFVGTTALFLDPRPGVVVGWLAGLVVYGAARS
jgi:hypothetical protein